MNLVHIARLTEDEARDYLESKRWPDGPVCPHCESSNCTRLNGKKHRPGCIQCNACRKQFTVTVNSVMERSKISLVNWILAFHLMCSSKKGISALQLQRELSLGSYKTAWFMCHRVRAAMADDSTEPLKGIVEADETYVGGKPRHQNNGNGKPAKRGRGTDKAPVMILVERDGRARVKPIERVDGRTLKGEIRDAVDGKATIMTDELSSYQGLGGTFEGGHKTVNHSQKEYVRFDSDGTPIHVNTAESFFALIKRGHYGVFHQLSRKHLHRYCDEFSFRWDHRKVNDSERTDAALRRIGGKRLMYETPRS